MDLIAIRSDEIRRVVKCVVCQGIAEIASKEIQGFRDEPFNIYRGEGGTGFEMMNAIFLGDHCMQTIFLGREC